MQDKEQLQIEGILEIVLSFAQMDFSKRAVLLGEDDRMDALAAGVNMLGEELQSSVISLKEKEVLLKEIHHRVKNNLQIITSILNLQIDTIDDVSSKEKIAECQSRIGSIALLHEKLYNSYNLKHIEVNDYLLSLSRSLIQTLPENNFEFLFSPLCVDYHADIDDLLPLGLILNELILNVQKHAFPSGQKGLLHVSIKYSVNQDQLELRVQDNGIGSASAVDTSDTLGYKLIVALTEQIDASLEIHSDQGTTVTLSFPAKNLHHSLN